MDKEHMERIAQEVNVEYEKRKDDYMVDKYWKGESSRKVRHYMVNEEGEEVPVVGMTVDLKTQRFPSPGDIIGDETMSTGNETVMVHAVKLAGQA